MLSPDQKLIAGLVLLSDLWGLGVLLVVRRFGKFASGDCPWARSKCREVEAREQAVTKREREVERAITDLYAYRQGAPLPDTPDCAQEGGMVA